MSRQKSRSLSVLLATTDELMLTPGECARIIGKSVSWLRELRIAGKAPPAYGPAHNTRYRLSEVCAYMNLPHPLNQKTTAE